MRWRPALRSLITIGLLAVVAWGITAGIVHGSNGDRVHQLTARLRCPVCQAESVAESPSQSAQEITTQVRQQVGAGWTDAQIEQFYVQRYGSWILLDPPRSGGTALLWAIPLVAASVGLIALVSHLERSPRRTVLIGVAAVLGLASTGSVVVLGLVQTSPTVAAPPLPTVTTLAGGDLSAVTNEQMEEVVTKNPAVVGMRLALAERYLADGEVTKALVHTAAAIDLPATDQEYEHALRLHGWVTALSGGAASGAAYLRAALALSPDDRDARWFLARVEFSGLGDAGAAHAALQGLDTKGMSSDQRAQFDQLTALVDAALGGPSVATSGLPVLTPNPPSTALPTTLLPTTVLPTTALP